MACIFYIFNYSNHTQSRTLTFVDMVERQYTVDEITAAMALLELSIIKHPNSINQPIEVTPIKGRLCRGKSRQEKFKTEEVPADLVQESFQSSESSINIIGDCQYVTTVCIVSPIVSTIFVPSLQWTFSNDS